MAGRRRRRLLLTRFPWLPQAVCGGAVLLSSVASVLACALWARSYAVPEVAWYLSGDRRWRVAAASSRGELHLRYHAYGGRTAGPSGLRYRALRPAEDLWALTVPWKTWRWGGFGCAGRGTYPPRALAVVGVPHWFVAVVCALPAARRSWAWHRARRRRRLGRCRRCGYALRASPVNCPECGTPGVAAAVVAGKGDAAA